jgi:hypothetical protein
MPAGRRSPRARRQYPPKVRGDRHRFVSELAPGGPRRPPALGEENPISLPVALERPLRPVNLAAVKLEQEPLLGPQAVRLEEPPTNRQRRVESRPRQTVGVEEGDEPLLEIVAGDSSRRLHPKQRPQVCRPGYRASRCGNESRLVSPRTSASFIARSSRRPWRTAARPQSVRDTEVTGIPRATSISSGGSTA